MTRPVGIGSFAAAAQWHCVYRLVEKLTPNDISAIFEAKSINAQAKECDLRQDG